MTKRGLPTIDDLNARGRRLLAEQLGRKREPGTEKIVRTRKVVPQVQPSATFTDGVLVVTLPHPKGTKPNCGHGHWAPKAAAKKALRVMMFETIWCVIQGQKPLWNKAVYDLAVVYRVLPKRVDEDNWVARMKSGLDALQDAGVVVDDCGLSLGAVTIVRGECNSVTITVGERA